MNLSDAVYHSRMNGVTVVNHGKKAKWFGHVTNGCFYWLKEDGSAGATVYVNDVSCNDKWEVAPKPPKEYDFAEAFEMMKKGTWMVPPDFDLQEPMSIRYEKWHVFFPNGNIATIGPRLFSQRMIEGNWTEYKP